MARTVASGAGRVASAVARAPGVKQVVQGARSTAQAVGRGLEAVEGAGRSVGEKVAQKVFGRASAVGSTVVDATHLAELSAKGVKFTPENVIATGRNSTGQVVFLESGNSRAGLQHIVETHGADFAKIGVKEADIPNVVMQAVTQGKLVGYQGGGTGRPIYEIMLNDQKLRIAVTASNNGFIVGANPAGRIK